MDDIDSVISCVQYPVDLFISAVDPYFSFVLLQYAAQNIDQCRFPGTVFPENCMDLSGPYTEVDPFQGIHAREPLMYILHL